MEGSMIGTSIQNLNQTKEKNDYYENTRNLQNINRINYNQQINTPQQYPYYDVMNTNILPNQSYNNQMNGHLNNSRSEINDIQELARDINENLRLGPNPKFLSKNTFDENISDDTFDSVSDISEDTNNKQENKFISSIPVVLREPLLILILYVILSQSIVKDTIGKYIPQINPNEDGKVSFLGILIYGIILSTLYAIIKNLFLNK